MRLFKKGVCLLTMAAKDKEGGEWVVGGCSCTSISSFFAEDEKLKKNCVRLSETTCIVE